MAAQAGLRRYVALDGRLAADPGRRLPGRGAYVCSPACLRAAARRRAFSRALKTPVATDLQTLEWTD